MAVCSRNHFLLTTRRAGARDDRRSRSRAPGSALAARAMPARVRLSVVGAAGTLPSKCSKCTVDAVVLVEPRHAALARAAINKLRLKVKDVERVKLVLKSAVREHAVGTELPCGEADLSSYLATD